MSRLKEDNSTNTSWFRKPWNYKFFNVAAFIIHVIPYATKKISLINTHCWLITNSLSLSMENWKTLLVKPPSWLNSLRTMSLGKKKNP